MRRAGHEGQRHANLPWRAEAGILKTGRRFGRLLRWLPDLRGEVDQWSASRDTVFIGWRLKFTLGRGPFELRILDRIVVRDGSIVEREACFDSLRFFLATVMRPTVWVPYLRYRGYLPGGGPGPHAGK